MATNASANKPAGSNGGQFIQSTFGTPHNPGNFEFVVLQARPDGNPQLVHCYRNNSHGRTWQKGSVISTSATDNGSIVQSRYGTYSSEHGNLEVLVREGNSIAHYWHDHAQRTWVPRDAFADGLATGPPSFIQSTYSDVPGSPRNFEAVILESQELMHYYRSNRTLKWHRTAVITRNALGPGSILRLSVRRLNPDPPAPLENHGPLAVAVPEDRGLVLYQRNTPTSGWDGGRVLRLLCGPEFSPGSFLESTLVAAPGGRGNFEFLIYTDSDVKSMAHCSYQNRNDITAEGQRQSDLDFPFKGNMLPGGSIVQSNYGPPGRPGNFEAVVVDDQEGKKKIAHWHLDNSESVPCWVRTQYITEVVC